MVRVAREHLLLLNFHHSVFDAWSLGVFWRELGALYGNRHAALPAPAFQYADYAAWQTEWLRGAEAERQRRFWAGRLAGELPPLLLEPAAAAAGSEDFSGAIHSLRFDRELCQAVRRVARDRSTTDFVIVLAAFVAVLRRYTLQDELVVGVPVAGRGLRESEGIIGCLTNTVALRVRLRQGLRFSELVDDTAQALAEALSNQDLPFDHVVDALAPERAAEGNPIFQAMFVMQSTPMDGALAMAGLEIEEAVVHSGTAKVDLTCSLRSTADGLEGEIEYAKRLSANGAGRWAASLQTALAEALRRPDAAIDQLAMLPDAARAQSIARANTGFETYPNLQPLHAGFEAQAQRNPEAIAVQAGGSVLSYRELNERADLLAGYLSRRGAGPESRVGVCIERSAELVVALLAILKCGAAFVPLDPTQPVARLQLIAEDADLLLVLARKQGLARLAPLPCPVISAPPASEDAAGAAAPLSLDHAAYIYYTSGSTGTPKGVVIDHRCAANRLAWLERRYPLRVGDRVLQNCPLIFDVAVWEIFGPLHAGATILMADPAMEADAAHIGELLGSKGVVFAHFVPSMLDTYLSTACAASYPDLRWVQVSGEAATGHLLDRFSAHFDAEFHNLYGQTETSEVAGWEGRAGTGRHGLPIGSQIGIYRLYILDEALNPVPPGVPGELFVAGCGGLARGYHRRPQLTAEKFLPNPHAVVAGARPHRTGDTVCADEDGLIRYRGK